MKTTWKLTDGSGVAGLETGLLGGRVMSELM